MKAVWLGLLFVAGAVMADTSNPMIVQRVPSKTIKTVTPRDDAKIDAVYLSKMNPKVGDVGDIIVTVTNTGTTTWRWTDSFHHDAIGFGPGGDRNYKGDKPEAVRISHPGGAMPGDKDNPFDGNRLTLQEKETVKPGATKKFGGLVEYKQPGTHFFVIQRVKDNGHALGQPPRPDGREPDGWNGELVVLKVTVANK